MSFPTEAFQASLYPEQEIRIYKDPLVIARVKQGLEYVKEKVWPWLQKLKGYGKFKWPDDIYVSDDLGENKPAATIFKKSWLGRIKKYLVVSKDILYFPRKLVEYVLAHEAGHFSENVGGSLLEEAMNDKNLKDVYEAKGEKGMARLIERTSGYLNKLYGLLGKILTPLACYYYIVKNRNI